MSDKREEKLIRKLLKGEIKAGEVRVKYEEIPEEEYFEEEKEEEYFPEEEEVEIAYPEEEAIVSDVDDEADMFFYS